MESEKATVVVQSWAELEAAFVAAAAVAQIVAGDA